MAYVDSNSTRDEVRAALLDNAAWKVLQSVDMAQKYAVAATVWLDGFAYDKGLQGPAAMEFARLNEGLQERLKDCQAWLASVNPPASRNLPRTVTRVGTANFRDS
jgi:hypothetical protein